VSANGCHERWTCDWVWDGHLSQYDSVDIRSALRSAGVIHCWSAATRTRSRPGWNTAAWLWRYQVRQRVKGWVYHFMANPLHSSGASPAMWDHTVLSATKHRWMLSTITQARQTGTWFTYRGRMEGWVHFGFCYWWRGVVGNALRLKLLYVWPS